ncbi:MAG: CHASE2 domain-containing protein [Limnospira sp.]
MFRIFKGLAPSQRQKLASLKQWLKRRKHIWVTSSGVAGAVILLRLFGLLQTSELAIFDLFIRLRPVEAPEDRIVIVGIDEADLEHYGFPVSDRILAELLQKINAAQPRAIGLDLYRGQSIQPGKAELNRVFETVPNLIGIELIEMPSAAGIAPPPILAERDQIGFNNFAVDVDSRVRRNILFIGNSEGQVKRSFALQLAEIELEANGIMPELTANQEVKFGEVVFPRFGLNDGSYVRADDRAYHTIANFRNPLGGFQTVSMRDVMNGEVSPTLFRDRLVLIGPTAFSVKDLHFTPYSSRLFGNPRRQYGVEVHANFLSQILTAVLDGRTLIHVWPDAIEWLWIVGWSGVGASVCWKLRSPYRSTTMIVLMGVGIVGGSYLALLGGWWIPVVPPLMTLGGSAIVVMAYLAHLQEELKRSTDFLNSVINTIPDPIYVKNKHHQKIVVNQAYAKLVGLPVHKIMLKTDYDLFDKAEADIFWQQDEQSFHTTWEFENEEKLTDSYGKTHWISTKRSLHQDAAGNQFLVGVIRDMTERKKSEEALRKRIDCDPLTGLPNRKLFEERLTQALDWADIQNKWVALLFLDLNDFKLINDTLGHQVGDLLLKLVAQRLQGCLRASDTVCRLGGDEFTVILPGIPSQADAARVAEKILHTVTENADIEGHSITIATSIGISLYPLHTRDREDLIHKADTAMYRAKRQYAEGGFEFAEP